MPTLRPGAILLSAALATGCISDRPLAPIGMDPGGTGDTTVQIANFAFAPQNITVHLGAVLEWTNTDPTIHTVTSDDNTFDSNVINPDGRYRLTTTRIGVFRYFCRIHPFMQGKVTVTP
ncbi:MAG: cupredoxin domain-containing protein [Gemmatimonadales bacterium]